MGMETHGKVTEFCPKVMAHGSVADRRIHPRRLYRVRDRLGQPQAVNSVQRENFGRIRSGSVDPRPNCRYFCLSWNHRDTESEITVSHEWGVRVIAAFYYRFHSL